MSDLPGATGEGAGQPAAIPPKPLGENPVLKFFLRPRILLMTLAVWSILGVLTQVFTRSPIFLDNHDVEIDGALAGLALSWQGIPLAALYLYASRDPQQYRQVFWVALIAQISAVAANLYHWGNGDFSIESIIIPGAVAAGLAALVFLHLFERRQPGHAGDQELTGG
jgi:hypothetical protein